MITAYLVPAVSVVGVAKLAEKYPPAPLLNPGIVVTARSDPVGTLPEVARIETVRFGVVPVQFVQKRSRSTLVKRPVIADVKVCPAQVVLVKLKPLFVTD